MLFSSRALLSLISLIAFGVGARAMEIPLNWRLYPTVDLIEPRVHLDLTVRDDELRVSIRVKDE